MILTITGHQSQRLKGQEKKIKEWAKRQLKKRQPSVVYCGMAQGVDQIIGAAAQEMGIPLICCYAYPKNKFHPMEEKIMDGNKVIFVSPQYSKKCEQIRDRYMVDHADAVLCVWDGVCRGGTYDTWKYAMQQGKKIIEYEGLKV